MAEKLVENSICENCGADVRLNALFCFNCGSQVASDAEVELESQNGNKVSDAWFRDTISDAKIDEIPTKTKKAKPVTKIKETTAIPKPTEILTTDASTTEIATKVEKTKTESLKTAASLRNRPKPESKKKIEVTWESHESAPNIWFLIVTIFLLAFAIFILFAMLYLR